MERGYAYIIVQKYTWVSVESVHLRNDN